MTTIDLSDTIIAKSDQLNAADIADELTIKITKATKKTETDQPIFINYEGDNGKPWKPCLSMRRVIAKLWGPKVDMTGRMITLICDPAVTWGGQEVGGIRIAAMSHIDKKKTVPLRVSRHKVVKYTVDVVSGSPATKEQPVDEKKRLALVEEGQSSADLGVETYKDWLDTLGDDDKAIIKDHHKKWSADAKKADEETPAV